MYWLTEMEIPIGMDADNITQVEFLKWKSNFVEVQVYCSHKDEEVIWHSDEFQYMLQC